jgi:RNA polymerase sigma factor (sigma-70 family)
LRSRLATSYTCPAVETEHATSRLSDAELVRRCREGSPEAWNEMVERFSRYVYAICSRGFGLNAEDAEDVFQDVFARVYARLDSLRDDAAIRPWIAQTTRRVCLDRIAATSREEPVDEIVAEDSGPTLDEIDEAFAVREALDELGDPCRELLDRFFARDESYRTIGDELDIPHGTIASRISRCLDKLRKEFEGRKPGRPSSGDQ